MRPDDITEESVSGWSSTDPAVSDPLPSTGSPIPAAAPVAAAPVAAPAAPVPEAAVVASVQEQATQGALFVADAPVLVPDPDETEATFGVPERDVPNAPMDVMAFVAHVTGSSAPAGDGAAAPTADLAPVSAEDAAPAVAADAGPATAQAADIAAIVADLDAGGDGQQPIMPLAADDVPEPPAVEPAPAGEPEHVPADSPTEDASTESAEAGEPTAALTPEDVAAAEAAAAAFAAAAEAAHDDAVTAVLEAGAPEGADNDADAVEALLEAEAKEPLLVAAQEPPDRTLSLPFYIYVGVWLVFSVVMVLVLQGAATTGGLDSAPQYPIFVLGGLVLTVVGPVLALFVWALRWFRTSGDSRRGLLATALLRGSLATFAGVAIWYIAIVVLNYMKTGRVF